MNEATVTPERVIAERLAGTGLPAALAAYEATIIGSLPLGIAAPGADLDIACTARDLETFARTMRGLFGRWPGYREWRRTFPDGPAALAAFRASGGPVEVFAQCLPVEQQMGVRHYRVERRLLALAGTALRDRIGDLKEKGVQTEAAFARVLGLAGDPYIALLALESASDDALRTLLSRRLEG